MSLDTHYTKLSNTIDHYEQVLNASYEEMINLVQYVINKNDMELIFENEDGKEFINGDHYEHLAYITIQFPGGKILYHAIYYHTGFDFIQLSVKYKLYHELFQSDFFKSLEK